MHRLHIIPALSDNYIWILENAQQQGIIIDPGESKPVIDYLTQQKITPIGILLTHHHHDHIGGVITLQKSFPNLPVYGPTEIPLPITYLANQTFIQIEDFSFEIIQVPGHTLGHIVYYCKPYLFSGDTLFSAGCGRLFEGTYQQMFESLSKLKILPDDTQICAAHEYTLSNLNFAHYTVPSDSNISQYLSSINKKIVTLPSTLAQERKINLFLRCGEQKLQSEFNCENEFDFFVFLREQKDKF